MRIVSSREFRANQAELLSAADRGEQVVIRRRNKRSYLLVPVDDSDFCLSDASQQRINQVRKEYAEGNYVAFATPSEAMDFLNDL
ncbi:MAG: type II toxin-antitoxin system Phd/YefM family antitoxin [Sodaliphilus sp.]